MTDKQKDADNDDLIHIGTIRSPHGGTRPWFATKDIKAKMDAQPNQPKTDLESCVLASYETFLDAQLEGLTPNTPEYEKKRKNIVEWLRKQINKEQQENNEV